MQRCRHRDKLVLTNNLTSSCIRRPYNNGIDVLEEETEEQTDNDNQAEQNISYDDNNEEQSVDVVEGQTNRQTE